MPNHCSRCFNTSIISINMSTGFCPKCQKEWECKLDTTMKRFILDGLLESINNDSKSDTHGEAA